MYPQKDNQDCWLTEDYEKLNKINIRQLKGEQNV